ncbi:MAG: Gfo/Idh/MocA family oxidoreductase [Cyclobacteriaceae bacterium]|nr:Gfo/Idh/MocA family oxidoreductase [Cyclobacteriaceae bacterium]
MIKTAVIGFGFMGMTHTANILKNTDIDLVAIIDKDVEGIDKKLKEGSGNFEIEGIDPAVLKRVSLYTSLRECLKKEALDAVHICVHTDLHFPLAKEALEAGLHVLVEKPFVLRPEEGFELIRIAQNKNRKLMVAHVLRFMPVYQQLKAWIEQKTYGKLLFLSMNRFSGVPAWGQWKEKQVNFGVSGGALFDLMIHDIDFVAHVLGQPDEIDCQVMAGSLSPHDYINATWRYNGRKIHVKIEGGNIFHSAFPFQAGFMARFEEASVRYTTMDPDSVIIARNDSIELVSAGDSNLGFYNEIAAFAESIKKNASVACTPESAIDTIELCYRHIL